MILPIASFSKFVISEEQFKSIEEELTFAQNAFDPIAYASDKLSDWNDQTDTSNLPHGAMHRAEGALLRELHSFLKQKDPGFGGLVRVMNKQQEFLWVHEKYASEY